MEPREPAARPDSSTGGNPPSGGGGPSEPRRGESGVAPDRGRASEPPGHGPTASGEGPHGQAGEAAGELEEVDELGPAIEECLEQLSDGDTGAIERLCAERPDRATEIRERVGLLLQMNLVPGASRGPEFPERLAEFRLLRRLGGGGMGVVYEAEQQPLGRTVALKLIRPEHLYFPRARERFRRETEAVARLAHPGIVAIHTVGEAAGVPYFAMELVEGATLAHVLAELESRAPEHLSGADLRAIVEARGAHTGETHAVETHADADVLFGASWVEACTRIAAAMADALEHAHSRGVLHRDIKPSNIAVTPAGRVVLLDFGLASSQDELRLTVSGSALGSVLYMAPEQVAGRTADIDRRTDVYALGVTLYELLTLRPPFGGDNAEQTRAAILEGRPPPLRLRNRQVSRELEIVCLKALERDSARRYSTMAEFGADLRAVLEGRPIRARSPGAIANAMRWARRRPATVAALACAALLVVGLPTGLYWQQRAHTAELARALDAEVAARRAADEASELASAEEAKAQLEAREAEQVAAFLVELFGASDPNRSGGAEVTARQLLERGRERVERALVDQPELAARLLERIGESYSAMNLYSDAVATLERAVELRTNSAGEDDRRTAFAKLALGKARRLAGMSSAAATLRDARDTLERIGQLETSLGVNAQVELAVALSERGRTDESLVLLESAREILERMPGDTRRPRSNVLSALAVVQITMQQNAAGEATARAALALNEELYPAPHPSRIGDLNSLATALAGQEKLDEADEVYARLLREALVLYGEDSSATLVFEMNQAVLLERRGRFAEAEAVYLRVFTKLREKLGLRHPSTLRAMSNLGLVVGRQGRHEDVRALFENFGEELEDQLGDGHAAVRFCRHRTALALEAQGDFDGAERVLRKTRAGFQPSDAPHMAWVDLSLAGVLRRSTAGADEARELAEPFADSNDLEIAVEARFVLASLDFEAGRESDAQAHVDAAFELAKTREPRHWAWPALRALRGRLALRQGRSDEGRADLEAGLAELTRILGPTHVEVVATAAIARQVAGLDAVPAVEK